MRTRALWLAPVLWPALAAWTSAQDGRELALARRLFVEIESAARLPSAQQADRLPRVYHDVCPQLRDLYAAHTVFSLAVAAATDERVEQAAERIEHAGGWPSLAQAGRRRCTEFMLAHRDAVEALVRRGLRGPARRDELWALHVIGDLRAVRLFDDAVSALGGPDPIFAAQALRALDDPHAIPPLIRRYRDDPTRFFDILRSLQRNRAPHPLLLELLRSKEAKVRWQAAYSLVESRDPGLVPVVPSLVADSVADVRRQAGYIALSFDEAGYRRVHPSMMPLLSDADVGVRADVAVAMASRMDRVSAPVLLALVTQEDTLEPWRQSNLVQAIHTLTGAYFGLSPGTPSAPPDRRQALKDFAQWIKEHPPGER